MPPTRTRAGMSRLGVEAGAAAQASPAAAAIATNARSTRCTGWQLEHVSRDFARARSREPSDGGRTLDCPMATGTWQIEQCSYGDVARLAAALELDDVTASVLVRRGLADPAGARSFL